jgi:predicted ATPase/DNA-binding NarL/FixJ family response regulator
MPGRDGSAQNPVLNGRRTRLRPPGRSAVAVPDGDQRVVSAPRVVTLLASGLDDCPQIRAAAPRAVAAATCAHRDLVLSVASRHGGALVEPSPEADAPVAEFSRPDDALAAALEIHRTARAQDWPDGLNERLRVALDTHTVATPCGQYGLDLDLAVSRSTRLCAVARAGQTLLSRATRDLIAESLPPDTHLTDQGVHALPDLGRPERVYELSSRGVSPARQPLRTLDTLPNNLPRELTTFIGRRAELRELRGLLAEARLLSLTGAGGCGKSRLALQAAAEAADRFSDGIWLVELASIDDGHLIGAALANALRVRPLPGCDPLSTAIAHLKSRRALVIVDNCEHMLEPVRDVTVALLEACPEITILATSRSPLALPMETTWLVPSLSLPRPCAVDPIETLVGSDAASLFVERARRVRRDFVVHGQNAAALASVCSKLDGMPLAIELAAVRVRVMSLEQIDAALSDRLGLLTAAPHATLSRHATLRASMEWSHDMLPPEERGLFRRLAVFTGGFTLDAAHAVAGSDRGEPTRTLGTLAPLVDQSLVVAEDCDGTVRYRLLETVREYALERLREAGELETLHDEHCDFFVQLAERAESSLVSGGARASLSILDEDAANLAAALEWALERKPDHALRLCAALAAWWKVRGMFAQGDAACTRALAVSRPEGDALRARVLWAQGYLLRYAGRYEDAVRPARRALELAAPIGELSTMARALHVLGMLRSTPDPIGSRPLLERARALARDSGDDWCFAGATIFMGWSYAFTDDYDQADRLFDECEAIVERLNYDEFAAWRFFGMSWRHQIEASFDRFFELAERAVAASRRMGEPVSEGVVRAVMAHTDLLQGRPEQALERIAATRERASATDPGYALHQTDAAFGYIQAAFGDFGSATAYLESTVESGLDSGWLLAPVLLQLAEVKRLAGDSAGAEHYARRGLDVATRISSPWHEAWAKWMLGRLATDRRDWSRADALLHEALAAQAERKMYLRITQSLDALAELAAARGSPEAATRLLAAADSARADLGIGRWAPDERTYAALTSDLRAALGDPAFSDAWREGADLSLEAAVAWVRRGRGSRKRPPDGWESLTPTELAVARHAATGLTNPDIAKAMFIERGTVKSHLSRIYAKLGVRNRAQLTAEVARRELLGR